jgi:hypothetical protein
MDHRAGGCLCGGLRFEARGAPDRVGLCHCLDCRKHHGAVFYAAAIFPLGQVTVHGQSQSYKGRHFCPRCGSSVFAISGAEIELHLGSFDAPNQFKPEYECWASRRESWLGDAGLVISYDQNRPEAEAPAPAPQDGETGPS